MRDISTLSGSAQKVNTHRVNMFPFDPALVMDVIRLRTCTSCGLCAYRLFHSIAVSGSTSVDKVIDGYQTYYDGTLKGLHHVEVTSQLVRPHADLVLRDTLRHRPPHLDLNSEREIPLMDFMLDVRH